MAFAFPYDHCIDFLRPEQDCLVFGGDIWDQGGSDLYVLRQLLYLKQRYPDQVHFVMGNRDINKMRLKEELSLDTDGLVPESTGVYWLRGSNLEGDPLSGVPLSQSPVERLQWILRRTMGCPKSFQNRKWELEQEELLKDPFSRKTISDYEVFESYQHSTSPHGELGQYMTLARPLLLLGEAMFVHGCLPMTSCVLEESRGALWENLSLVMPWLPEGRSAQTEGVETVFDWIHALNDFAVSSVREWREEPTTGVLYPTIGGYQNSSLPNYFRLLQYGMGWDPQRVRNPAVVYNSWTIDGMPRRFFPNTDKPYFKQATQDFFQRSGISLICCGHQPQGDMPNTIRIELEGRNGWVVCADTSYSGDTVFWSLPLQGRNLLHKSDNEAAQDPPLLSGRGTIAASEVVIEQCIDTGKILDVHMHGRLRDGTLYRAESLDMESTDEKHLGLEVGALATLPERSTVPWWTRCKLATENKASYYVLGTGKGHTVWNRFIRC